LTLVAENLLIRVLRLATTRGSVGGAARSSARVNDRGETALSMVLAYRTYDVATRAMIVDSASKLRINGWSC
jgi:hypothetical protein